MRPSTRAAILALLVALGCQSDTDQPLCRTFPVSMSENGRPMSCSISRSAGEFLWSCGEPGARLGRLSRSVVHRSLEEFVLESSVPHRLNRVRWTSATGPGMFPNVDGATTTLRFGYDSRGRLLERGRDDGEVVSFSRWDSQGRPTSATVSGCAAADPQPVTITYDDGMRTASWSNGERHVVDANGSPVSETLVYCSFRTQRDYEVLATARVCEGDAVARYP